MVSLTSLWLPILLSAVAVFIVSSIIHMFLPYHRSDFSKLAAEDDVMAALGRNNIPVGEYMFPYAGSMSAMKDPAWIEKRKRGPAGILSVMPSGMPGMGKFLGQWFVYSVVISVIVAHLATGAFGAGAESAELFHLTAISAFLAYGFALIQSSIWFNRAWSVTLKALFDAALYGATTGAVFVWLWPK